MTPDDPRIREARERCEGRYPVPQTSPPRSEPFEVTYRCALLKGHDGPHGDSEAVTWRSAALRIGEELSSTGPEGYYGFGPEQWLEWALDALSAAEHAKADAEARAIARLRAYVQHKPGCATRRCTVVQTHDEESDGRLCSLPESNPIHHNGRFVHFHGFIGGRVCDCGLSALLTSQEDQPR